MKYIGLNSQIWRNNFKSVILLILFPVVILGLVWLFVFLVQPLNEYRIERANQLFLTSLPWVLAGVGVWFVIAWFSHTGM
ncbi:MAG TPA: protease, partial [Bacteroidales bacterium]|nr:protease [Bacteroidales bacterium]